MGTATFTIGAEVACLDGECGTVQRIIFNPLRRELTHLVVEPFRGHRNGRMVPVKLVDPDVEDVVLRCTLEEFHALPDADEADFLLAPGGALGYAEGATLALPYFGLGLNETDAGRERMGRDASLSGATGPAAMTYDRVPPGEVEVRRGDRVDAVDGTIGRVRGLVVHPEDEHITHLLLEEGHLFGSREVAIPILAVVDVGEGVRLDLTKEQVRDLPTVEVAES